MSCRPRRACASQAASGFLEVLGSVFRDVLRAITSFLVAAPATSTYAKADAPGAADRPHPAADDDMSFQQAMHGRSHVVAGSLELIGLDDVRDALGEDWPALSNKVTEFAEQEMQRCLDPTDIFRRHGESGYLIHFDGLDKVAAETKASRTALRIKARLVEQMPEVAEAISIKHFVTDLDPASIEQLGRSFAESLYDRIMRLRYEAEGAAARDRTAIRDFQVTFSPMWHARRQVTVLNRCLLSFSTNAASFSHVTGIIDPAETVAINAELDCLALTKSLEALHRTLRSNRGCILLIPLRIGTIGGDAGSEYVRLLRAMPESYKKFVALELCDLSPRHSPAQVRDAARVLKRYVRHVAVQLAVDEPRIKGFARSGVWAVSVDLTGQSSFDTRVRLQLGQFTSAVSSAAVSTLACGAGSIGLALMACDAGFTFIDGHGIHLPVKEPKSPQPLRPLARPRAIPPARPV